jgi:hypothetical protein
VDEPIDPNAEEWHGHFAVPVASWGPGASIAEPTIAAPRPRRDRRSILWAATTALIVLAGLVVAISLGTRAKPAPSLLVVPPTIGDYEQITDATADQVQSEIESGSAQLGIERAFFQHTSFGVYGTSGTDEPALILIAGRTDSVPGMQSDNADQAARMMLEGAVDSPTRYSTAKTDGALECGVSQFGVEVESLCAWYDGSTIGMLVSVQPALAPAVLAELASSVEDELP